MKILEVPLYMQGEDTAYCVPYSILGIAAYYGLDISRKLLEEAYLLQLEWYRIETLATLLPL